MVKITQVKNLDVEKKNNFKFKTNCRCETDVHYYM